MNRAPSTDDTNGKSNDSAVSAGGYDAFFSQVSEPEATESTAPGTHDAERTEVTWRQPPRAAAPPTVGTTTAVGQTLDSPTVQQSEGQGGSPAETSAQTPESAAPAVTAQQPSSTPPPNTAWEPPPRPEAETPGPLGATPQQQASYEPPPYETAAPQTPPAGPHYSDVSYQAGSSMVPDRIERASYGTSTPRVEVLPPTMASAELLADIAAARQAHLRSTQGMRGALNKVGFKFGLSPAEQRAENRRNKIRTQLTAPYQIAVISVKGGVGRTTVTAALGSTLAELRPDRVLAVDANPDFGDLTTRTARHPYGLSLRDLAQAQQRLDSFSAVHAYTSVNTADLAVIASPWNTDANEPLSGREFHIGSAILRKHYNLMVVDCGTGVLDSVTNTVLQTSDSVVVVTPATVGGVTGAVATLNWLSSHGFDHLIASSLVGIVQQVADKPVVEVEAIEKLFATAQRPTQQIPYDPHLAEGGEIDLRLLNKDTGLAFEEMAAALADYFPTYGAGPSAAGESGDWR